MKNWCWNLSLEEFLLYPWTVKLRFICRFFVKKLRKKLQTMGNKEWQSIPIDNLLIPFLKFFGEEAEKTIEYRFFNDVTKTRRVSRWVYRTDDSRLCFRKWWGAFFKKPPTYSSPINHNLTATFSVEVMGYAQKFHLKNNADMIQYN